MKIQLFAMGLVQGVLFSALSAQGADNPACVNMAKVFYGPTGSSDLISAQMDLSCSDSKGNRVCISHDKEAIRVEGVWSGGTFDYLTLFRYPSDSAEEAARRTRDGYYTIQTSRGHRVSSTATTLLTFGAQTSNYVSDYVFTVKVKTDLSGASLKIKETPLLGSTLTNETLRCERMAPNWRPTGWPRLLQEYTRADGAKFKVGDVVVAPIKAQPSYYRDRRHALGDLAPGRISMIYDNRRDPVRFAIVGSGRPVPSFYSLKDFEPSGPVDTRGGSYAEENARFKWTEASELKLLASGPIEPLFRAGTLPETDTLDISTDIDCYVMGAQPANPTAGAAILRFELGGGNLRETRMGAGILEKNASQKALISAWQAARDQGADLRYLIRQIRLPGYQGRAWAVARERKEASSPERYWLCPADAR